MHHRARGKLLAPGKQKEDSTRAMKNSQQESKLQLLKSFLLQSFYASQIFTQTTHPGLEGSSLGCKYSTGSQKIQAYTVSYV